MDNLDIDLTDIEYVVSVTDYTDTDRYTLLISKVGGGTYGQKYSGRWLYVVLCNGTEIMRGDDFECGPPMSHREVAMSVISYHTDHVTEYDFQFPVSESYWDETHREWIHITA